MHLAQYWYCIDVNMMVDRMQLLETWTYWTWIHGTSILLLRSLQYMHCRPSLTPMLHHYKIGKGINTVPLVEDWWEPVFGQCVSIKINNIVKRSWFGLSNVGGIIGQLIVLTSISRLMNYTSIMYDWTLSIIIALPWYDFIRYHVSSQGRWLYYILF